MVWYLPAYDGAVKFQLRLLAAEREEYDQIDTVDYPTKIDQQEVKMVPLEAMPADLVSMSTA